MVFSDKLFFFFSIFWHLFWIWYVSYHEIKFIKTPIICGREPTAAEEEKKLGAERSAELSSTVNQVILLM